MRSIVLAALTCLSFLHPFSALAAGSEALCKEALAPVRLATPLKEELAHVTSLKSDFPQHDAFNLLQERYSELNQKVDILLDRISKHLESPIIKNTALLVKINAEIYDQVQRIQKLTNPGKIKKWVTDDRSILSRTSQTINDISFCRSKGESCLLELRQNTVELKEFHTQLREALESIRSEMAALEEEARVYEDQPSVRAVILGQLANLHTTSMIFDTQLVAHHRVIDAAIVATATFENDFKNIIRSLLTESSPGLIQKQKLADLHDKNNKDYDPAVQKFPPGTLVYAFVITTPYTNRGNHFDYYVDPGVVVDWTQANEIVVQGKIHVQKEKSNDRTAKNGKVKINPRDLVMQGCHEGICFDDEILMNGVSWVFPAHEDNRGYYGPHAKSFSDEKIKIIGYSPIRQSFLFWVQRSDVPHWIPESTLIAAKAGLVNAQGFYGTYSETSEKFEVGDLIMTEHGYLARVRTVENNEVFFGWDYHVKIPSKIGCFYGFCSGQALSIAELSQSGQVVLGYDIKSGRFLLDVTTTKMNRNGRHEEKGLRWVSRSKLQRMAAEQETKNLSK